jgi:hypothetical protein
MYVGISESICTVVIKINNIKAPSRGRASTYLRCARGAYRLRQQHFVAMLLIVTETLKQQQEVALVDTNRQTCKQQRERTLPHTTSYHILPDFPEYNAHFSSSTYLPKT